MKFLYASTVVVTFFLYSQSIQTMTAEQQNAEKIRQQKAQAAIRNAHNSMAQFELNSAQAGNRPTNPAPSHNVASFNSYNANFSTPPRK